MVIDFHHYLERIGGALCACQYIPGLATQLSVKDPKKIWNCGQRVSNTFRILWGGTFKGLTVFHSSPFNPIYPGGGQFYI